MEDVPIIGDSEIRDRVESLVGKNSRILDCQKKSSLVTEEVLTLNGQQVRLVGEAGERIKRALKAGQPPPPELLAEILQRAGIENAAVELETTMHTKSNTKTSELSTLHDSQGNMLDEKLKELEENDEYESTNVEMWEKEPKDMRDELERHKNKMWDFYNQVKPHISPKPVSRNSENRGTPTSFTSETTYSNSEKESVKTTHKNTTRESPNDQINYAKNVPEQSPIISNNSVLPKSPGKMPPLSKPSNPKIRPLVPPKPQWSSSALKREKNFTLPVRVVYETFI